MKDFLAISDYSSEEIQDMLDLAAKLKKQYFKKGNKPIFKGKVLGMIFQKPSLRTRVSFGRLQPGGDPADRGAAEEPAAGAEAAGRVKRMGLSV